MENIVGAAGVLVMMTEPVRVLSQLCCYIH